MITLLLVSRNRHKASEIGVMAGASITRVLTLSDIGFTGEIHETGQTFDDNARIKVEAVLAFLPTQNSPLPDTPLLALADDSGLEVDALAGQPGVYSARYAGEPSNDQANNQKLLQTLANISEAGRGAQFRCVLAAAWINPPPGKKSSVPPSIRLFQGICRGRIGFEPKGCQGFGYDPLFIPDGKTKTFAELSAEEKNLLSHRARAMAHFREWLERESSPAAQSE
ncbi:MAG: RdgB/HAM1 family non-canonical purine NTP pyrophosphatase [Verrucomicrobiae bacterium]|nr:RdgB/HAM1 family non-canonical purine NTP pyrophosphatase [Verrucomicrobiae bacterium]